MLQYQQEREYVEYEPLEAETALCAGAQHLLGRIITGHLQQSVVRRDAAV